MEEKLTLVYAYNTKTRQNFSVFLMLPYINPTTVADLTRDEINAKLKDIDRDLVVGWYSCFACGW